MISAEDRMRSVGDEKALAPQIRWKAVTPSCRARESALLCIGFDVAVFFVAQRHRSIAKRCVLPRKMPTIESARSPVPFER